MRRLLPALLVMGPAGSAVADEISAAVAANFIKPAEVLAEAFTAKTGDTVVFSFGATGQLYAQISQGAPFDVFLSADSARPAKAVEDGYGVPTTVFTYAVGKLALYSPTIDLHDGEAVLSEGSFQHLAVADARTAPYGAAAAEALQALDLTDTVEGRMVIGENISQTLQFVQSGNAELGLVAWSQVIGEPEAAVWLVPETLYRPIRQDAVLLAEGRDNAAAIAFLDFLRSDEARTIIGEHGYGTE